MCVAVQKSDDLVKVLVVIGGLGDEIRLCLTAFLYTDVMSAIMYCYAVLQC